MSKNGSVMPEGTPTFLVYGGNSAGCPAGNAQRAVFAAFPEKFVEIETCIRHERELAGTWDGDCWPLDTNGAVRLSGGEGGVRLAACTVFPRDARRELEDTRVVFREAVRLAVTTGAGPGSGSHGDTGIRIVTHGLGVFTGHRDPPRFAQAMARGLEDFLAYSGLTPSAGPVTSNTGSAPLNLWVH